VGDPSAEPETCDFGYLGIAHHSDGDGDDPENPTTGSNDTKVDSSEIKIDPLASKALAQLKYKVRLTDGVLQFLVTVVHHQSKGHLMAALWVSVNNPPQLSGFLKSDSNPVAMFFPMYVDTEHWILVHVSPQTDHTHVSVYDSLPTAERTASVSKALWE
jgi:hypothetical protein